ncbi:MAG: inositol monophosphatase family protein [bacterium]|nr:inositol monophosphatase family protein [bacterium]
MDTNLTSIRKELINIVLEAGKRIDGFLESGFSSHSKGGSDFATEADDAIDLYLREKLSKRFPHTSFLTEETAPSEYASFVGKDNLWVIDPIDGTTNFSRGSMHFSVSVGLVDRGKAKLGVVYLPLEKKLYWAQSDMDKSYLNELPIKVSSTSSLKEALLCCDWSWDIEKRKKTLGIFSKILPNVRAIQSRGSASVEIVSVASGNIDAYFVYGLKPWDVGAGLLIAEKAGASIRSLNGSDWTVFSSDLLIANGVIDNEILSYFP